MIRSSKLLEVTILLLASTLPSVLFAQVVGQAVGVSQAAFLERNGQRTNIERNETIALGDVITTTETGQVQVLFQDGTKMAIGRNSRLVIERILFDSSNQASEFTVNAVGGAFRFLSGDSNPSAYSIRTSQATMGIRGTEFDFAANSRGEVRVATFTGEVELCNLNRQCVRVRSGCSVAGLNDSGQFMIPEDKNDESILIQNGFPFIRNQAQLREDYRTRVDNCAGGAGGTSAASSAGQGNGGGGNGGNSGNGGNAGNNGGNGGNAGNNGGNGGNNGNGGNAGNNGGNGGNNGNGGNTGNTGGNGGGGSAGGGGGAGGPGGSAGGGGGSGGPGGSAGGGGGSGGPGGSAGGGGGSSGGSSGGNSGSNGGTGGSTGGGGGGAAGSGSGGGGSSGGGSSGK